MADDVKVKFSGDFTDVPKGAEAAANAAGTAMKGWFKDFGKSIVAPIAGFFAADAVFGQIKDFLGGMREQLSAIREINHAIKKSGLDPKEFQQLAYVAKDAGISVEGLGKAMNFANVYIAKAQGGSESHRKTLKAIFNTTQDLNWSTLKASDVFYRLADAYQDASQEGKALALFTEVFGRRQGMELVPLLDKGGSAIRKQAEEYDVLTKSQLEAAEALDKVIRKLERQKAIAEKKAAVSAAVQMQEGEIAQAIGSARNMANIDPFKKSEEENKAAFKENLQKILKERNLDPYMVGEFLRNQGRSAQERVYYGKSGATEEGRKAAVDDIINFLQSIKEETSKAPRIGKAVAENVAALTASSLQQIGGGDITSVMSGLATNSIEDNTRRTAEATERLANKETPKPTQTTLR